MQLVVANTDKDWFDFLAVRAEGQSRGLEEVNFWQPSAGRAFRALQPGQPFLFKLKYPHHKIAGGGVFLKHQQLPLKLAWDAFGQANGAATLEQMKALIDQYRSDATPSDYRYKIGCILIHRPFFLPEDAWLPAPRDWAKNIVAYRGYDTEDQVGAEVWRSVQPFFGQRLALPGRTGEGPVTVDEMFGDEILVRPRLGQGSFRTVITEAYEYRCAVTDGKILPVLEAAHIMPVSKGGRHDPDNGVLLRSDIHTLFDKGYVTITPDLEFRASPELHDEFDNGRDYRKLDGHRVRTPGDEVMRPNREHLEWHRDVVFRR